MPQPYLPRIYSRTQQRLSLFARYAPGEAYIPVDAVVVVGWLAHPFEVRLLTGREHPLDWLVSSRRVAGGALEIRAI